MATKPAKKPGVKRVAKTAAKPPKSAPAGTPEVKLTRREALDKITRGDIRKNEGFRAPSPVVPAPAPKVCRLWHVSGAGYRNRKVEAVGADEAAREFCACNMTGGNLAEIGTGIANPNRSVDFVAVVDGARHLLTVEEAK